MSTAVHRPAGKKQDKTARWEKDGELYRRVIRDMIERPDAYDDIPNGCVLILIPDDDPAQSDWAIQQGIPFAHRGRNVYLRHVIVSELPPLPEPNPAAAAGMKRTSYDRDGSIGAVAIRSEDGTWHAADLSLGEPPFGSPDDSAE